MGGNFMKIVVLTGSPHRHGTSALLADEFIRGAKESGCGDRADIEASDYLKQAYEAGKDLT